MHFCPRVLAVVTVSVENDSSDLSSKRETTYLRLYLVEGRDEGGHGELDCIVLSEFFS